MAKRRRMRDRAGAGELRARGGGRDRPAGPRRPRVSSGGRNSAGRRTVRHRGGGHRRSLRALLRREPAGAAVHLGWEYDPGRRAYLSRRQPASGPAYFRLATAGLAVGETVLVAAGRGEALPLAADGGPQLGSRRALADLPLDQPLHSVELRPGAGAQLARGAPARRVSRDSRWARVRLPSGEQRRLSLDCRATLGPLAARPLRELRKAGNSRWLGRRPRVRGVARNPVDHPLGGGEGRSSGGRPTGVSPWGRAEGARTASGRGRAYVLRPRR